MPILRVVAHLRFKLFPALDIGVRKGVLHQRAQRCSLGRIHAVVIRQVVHDFVEDPRGPVKTKTAGRRRAQQRVAQYHGEQNIGVEDGDQHRGTRDQPCGAPGLAFGGVVAFVAFARHIASMPVSPRTSSGKKQPRSSEAVPALERTAAARIAALLSPKSAKGRGMLQVVDPKGQRLELPTTLTDVMYRAAELLAKGRPVAVLPEEEMLSTQEAADLLNVSRQYLVRLVDAGELAAVKVGSHRRLRVAEIVAFKAARDAKRTSTLDRLTAFSEEAGGYAIDKKRR
jgi:excisionase family DNA binding protein